MATLGSVFGVALSPQDIIQLVIAVIALVTVIYVRKQAMLSRAQAEAAGQQAEAARQQADAAAAQIKLFEQQRLVDREGNRVESRKASAMERRADATERVARATEANFQLEQQRLRPHPKMQVRRRDFRSKYGVRCTVPVLVIHNAGRDAFRVSEVCFGGDRVVQPTDFVVVRRGTLGRMSRFPLKVDPGQTIELDFGTTWEYSKLGEVLVAPIDWTSRLWSSISLISLFIEGHRYSAPQEVNATLDSIVPRPSPYRPKKAA
jgi:NADH:ubiquinone oxidoreductase subunit H